MKRLIDTIPCELPDLVPIRHAEDLERKLRHFRDYYNTARVHHFLGGVTASVRTVAECRKPHSLTAYREEANAETLSFFPGTATGPSLFEYEFLELFKVI